MLDGIIWLWYVLTALSVIYVIWDQFVNTPSMRLMTWAWFLVVLYTGPIGLFFYLISCRQPMPGSHDAFIKDHWKQALGSEIHCIAGDATGIIISAFIISFFSIANGWETIIEYWFAYFFGLLIFQALFMLSMFKSYGQAVYKSIFAETVSMNFVMAGMLPLVVTLRHTWPHGVNPANPTFWFIMSIATLGGFITGYPINSYLVRKHEKHGMMSKPTSETAAKMTSGMPSYHSTKDKGSCGTYKPEKEDKECCGTCGDACQHKRHNHGSDHKYPKAREYHDRDHKSQIPHKHQSDRHTKQKHHSPDRNHHDHKHSGMDHASGHEHHDIGGKISTVEKWGWVLGSYALLIGIFWLMSIWIPVRFT